MKRNAIIVAFLYFSIFMLPQAAAGQANSNLAGTWYITIQNFGGPGSPPHQGRWTLQQDGTKITGIGKNPNGELSLTGTLTGNKLRMEATPANDQARHNEVQATLNGDSIEGMIQMGKDGHVWLAHRYATVSGEWNILTTAPALRGQWSIEQTGSKLTGHMKDSDGTFPLTGTLAGPVLRVEGMVGNMRDQIDATVDIFTNSMDGTLKVNGKEYLFAARRLPVTSAKTAESSTVRN
jgi:hypothetical protein